MRSRLAPMLVSLLALAPVLPARSAAQQSAPPIIDPALRLLLSPQMRPATTTGGRFDLLPVDAPLPLAGVLAVSRDVRGRPTVGLFLELADRAALDELRARARVGTVVRTAEGHFLVTARAPLDLADSLTRTRGLVAMYAARVVKSHNDSGVKAIHADSVRQLNGSSWIGSAGQGVIVGIYDTGIDFRHGDFLDGSGNTRLIGLWDQTLTGGGPGFGQTTGTYCTQAMIQAAINNAAGGCPTVDSVGHGTHVAGTAGGNGGGAGTTGTKYQYAGIAPAADLLVVKGGNGSFAFDQIVDGLAWIDSMSVKLHRPAVVNLSLGGQSGPHDGTTIPEQMIDAMARPGFVVVVAAGNEGSNGSSIKAQTKQYIHAGAVINTGETQTYTVIIPQYTAAGTTCAAGGGDFQDIDLWYNGQDNLDITVTRPDGTSTTVPRDSIGGSLAVTGDIYIDNGKSSGLQSNGEYEAQIQFNDCSSISHAPAPGTWKVSLTGRSATSGKMYHMWLDYSSFGASGLTGTGGQGFDNRYIIGTPGTARSVVTVAAFTSRTSWKAVDGASYGFVDASALGDIADFSSGGPAADERPKPDIAAPGSAVISTLSRTIAASTIAAPTTRPLVAPDSLHWALAGTSMATPHTTGAVALLLQANPTLTSDQVKAILTVNASHDAFTSRTYGGGAASDWWGAGKLNVKTALLAMNLNPNAVAGVALNLHADSLPRNATDKLVAIAYNGMGLKLDSVVTWSSNNPSVASVDATGLVRALSLGSAVIQAVVGTHQDSAIVQVVGPSVLALTGTSIAPSKAVNSMQGTRMPLLELLLKVTGVEAMKVTGLAFDVTGRDPGAQLVLLRDLTGNGVIDANDPVAASVAAPLSGGTQPTRVTFTLDSSLVVTGNGTSSVIVALQLSGQNPNLSSYSATLVPAGTHTLGARSLVVDQFSGATAPVASTPVVTTVFGAADPPFLMSENPVRTGHVVLNFQSRPTVAAIYTLTGRRVVDLIPRLDGDGRVDWTLTNDHGDRIVPGIYLAVFQINGQTIRQKIFVASRAPAGASPQE